MSNRLSDVLHNNPRLNLQKKYFGLFVYLTVKDEFYTKYI